MAGKSGSTSSVQYDLFEVLTNGSIVQRASVSGLEAAWQKLYDLAKQTGNECFALHAPTRQVVAQVNVPLALERARKLIFQIAYTETLGIARSEELTRRGYRVTTVIGNERAKIVLTDSPQHYDLFVLGHGAPDKARSEMVAWLRVKYPNVKILGLNSIQGRLREADYNVLLDGPETWMPIVARAFA